MGDRANIIIHQYGTDSPVYIYTYWHGSALPALLARALDTPQARNRVGDPSYLTRIVFSQIIKLVDDLDGETGWGIGTSAPDNGHDFIHLDSLTGQVAISEGETKPTEGWTDLDDFVREAPMVT